jgi:hypothetical protein
VRVPGSEPFYVDFSEEYEEQSVLLLGNLGRSAEALEGVEHLLKRDPCNPAYCTQVPGVDDLWTISIELTEGEFLVYYTLNGDNSRVRLEAIYPVKPESLD